MHGAKGTFPEKSTFHYTFNLYLAAVFLQNVVLCCRSIFDTIFYILICDGDAFSHAGNGLWSVLQPQSNSSVEDGTSV